MIITYKDLNKLQNQKTIYTAGSFDLFHSGHVAYIKKIKKEFPDHKLIVGILTDNRIRSKKGLDRPIINQKDRLIVLEAIRFVDYAFICPQGGKNGKYDDVTELVLKKLRPDIVAFPEKKYLKKIPMFEKYGSKLVILPRSPRQSTTTIIRKIKTVN